MTYRVVALSSAEASDARLGNTVAERLQMVSDLSRMAWAASGRPLPVYSRAEMPVHLSTLAEQGDGESLGER